VTGAASDGDGVPAIVRLTGEIDLANVGEHRDRILAAGSERPVVLDLDEVTYLDSAGIGMLDDVVSTFAENGWPLRLVCSPGAMCRRTLELGAPGLLLAEPTKCLSDWITEV
jgi:anti-anti-sigma factor